MNKKLSGFLLTVFCCGILILCSCNNNSESTDSSVTVVTVSSTVEETTTLETTTEATTTLPTPTPTPVPEYVEPIMDETWYDGYVDPRSVRATIVENPEDSYITLVNKYYSLDPDYEPSDLITPAHAGDQTLRKEAAYAYENMYDACKEATGTGIYLVSGYRSFSTQTYLFKRSCNNRSVPFACKRNAYQGRSEHQLGLAIDICPEGKTKIWDDFGETVPGKWVNEHCYEYGFIRRFQSKYSKETGYDNEAWHYRYVGVEVATYLYEHDMSLEAYLGKTQVLPSDE